MDVTELYWLNNEHIIIYLLTAIMGLLSLILGVIIYYVNKNDNSWSDNIKDHKVYDALVLKSVTVDNILKEHADKLIEHGKRLDNISEKVSANSAIINYKKIN